MRHILLIIIAFVIIVCLDITESINTNTSAALITLVMGITGYKNSNNSNTLIKLLSGITFSILYVAIIIWLFMTEVMMVDYVYIGTGMILILNIILFRGLIKLTAFFKDF